MNYYYQLIIQYNGRRYKGFQWQKDLPTIQDQLNQAFAQILHAPFSTKGTSRTDTGVHALDQRVKLTTTELLDTESVLRELQKNLPFDIKALEFSPSSHQTTTYSKEYVYLFTNAKAKSSHECIANIAAPLDLMILQEILNELLGEHDFASFYSKGSNVSSTIRTITAASFSRVNPHDLLSSTGLFPLANELTECYQLRFEGKGFLKQMIRHLVSALWQVASHQLHPREFWQAKKRKVAPAKGLFLSKIY